MPMLLTRTVIADMACTFPLLKFALVPIVDLNCALSFLKDVSSSLSDC